MESIFFKGASRCEAATGGPGVPGTAWLSPLIQQRRDISLEVAKAFTPAGAEVRDDDEDLFSPAPVNLLRLHAMHRRRLYLHYSRQLSHVSDAHYFYKFMMWCHDNSLFIHPSVQMHLRRSEFRDHVFTVREDVPRLAPLLAIPEKLIIGFKDANAGDDDKNTLFDKAKEKAFHKQNMGDDASSDTDICQFFFSSLGMIVSDLVTAKSSPLTDVRHLFADSLAKVRTLQNAPYFDSDAAFTAEDAENPCLADVLLQMIRNYVNGGPLVNKVPKGDLQWAASVCLSHSTPLTIGSVNSIGIIPLVHFFPHGGQATNAYVVARTARSEAALKMSLFFKTHFGFDFGALNDGKWIYVVPDRALKAGEEIRLQAMAPVCDKDSEAEQMWRLSCGSVPSEYMSSTEVSEKQAKLTQEIIHQGEALLMKGAK